MHLEKYPFEHNSFCDVKEIACVRTITASWYTLYIHISKGDHEVGFYQVIAVSDNRRILTGTSGIHKVVDIHC